MEMDVQLSLQEPNVGKRWQGVFQVLDRKNRGLESNFLEVKPLLTNDIPRGHDHDNSLRKNNGILYQRVFAFFTLDAGDIGASTGIDSNDVVHLDEIWYLNLKASFGSYFLIYTGSCVPTDNNFSFGNR